MVVNSAAPMHNPLIFYGLGLALSCLPFAWPLLATDTLGIGRNRHNAGSINQHSFLQPILRLTRYPIGGLIFVLERFDFFDCPIRPFRFNHPLFVITYHHAKYGFRH